MTYFGYGKEITLEDVLYLYLFEKEKFFCENETSFEDFYQTVTQHNRILEERCFQIGDWEFLEFASTAKELHQSLRFHFEETQFVRFLEDYLVSDVGKMIFQYLDGYYICTSFLEDRLVEFLESCIKKDSLDLTIHVLEKSVGSYKVEVVEPYLIKVYLLGCYYKLDDASSRDNPFYTKYIIDEKETEHQVNRHITRKSSDSFKYLLYSR